MGKLNEIRSAYLSSETVDGDVMLGGCGHYNHDQSG